MKPEEIESHEKIGTCDKGDLYHILTKGGFSIIAHSGGHGSYIPIAKAGHIAHAKHIAEKLGKNVKWDERLNKSQNFNESPYNLGACESTPRTHVIVADHAAMLAGCLLDSKDQDPGVRLQKSLEALNHILLSVKHFQMSGLDLKKSEAAMAESMGNHDVLISVDYPTNPQKLEEAWQEANPDKKIVKSSKIKR